MKLSKHIGNIVGFLQLKAKKNLDSDNLTPIKTIPKNAKYSQYWEFLTVFWQEIVGNFHIMTVFSQDNDRKIKKFSNLDTLFLSLDYIFNLITIMMQFSTSKRCSFKIVSFDNIRQQILNKLDFNLIFQNLYSKFKTSKFFLMHSLIDKGKSNEREKYPKPVDSEFSAEQPKSASQAIYERNNRKCIGCSGSA